MFWTYDCCWKSLNSELLGGLFFSPQQLLPAAVKSVCCRLRSRTLFLTVRSRFFDWEQLAGKHLQSSALAVKKGAGGALDSEWPAGGVT